MLSYLIKRFLLMIPTLFIISVISFIIIQLPPGDFLTTFMAQLAEQGQLTRADIARLDDLRTAYGLDEPVTVQYVKWIGNILTRGDFGYSFAIQRPVSEIIWSRLGYTFIVVGASMLFMLVVAIPIGVYSAVRQYSPGDYLFSFIGFLGLGVPNFLLALIILYIGARYFGSVPTGLFSPEYVNAPWSWAKVGNLLQHIWIPTVIVGSSGTASLIRVLRNNLLDELPKPYVMTARSKGIHPLRLLLKYPVRIALNPFLSTAGWLIPSVFGATVTTSIVLGLPDIGPIYHASLISQDMYLAGSIVLILASFTVVGTFVSDLLLSWADPRIRYD